MGLVISALLAVWLIPWIGYGILNATLNVAKAKRDQKLNAEMHEARLQAIREGKAT